MARKPLRVTTMLAVVLSVVLLTGSCGSSNSTDEADTATATSADTSDGSPKSPETSPSADPSGPVESSTGPSKSAARNGESSKRDTNDRPHTRPATQNQVLSSLPGSSSPKCVEVEDNRDARAGGIAAGNFQAARKQYTREASTKEQPRIFLYVIPEHVEKDNGVRIELTSLTGSGETHTVKSSSFERAEQWRYYSVHVPIPAPGKWRMQIASGADKGCFDVRFSR